MLHLILLISDALKRFSASLCPTYIQLGWVEVPVSAIRLGRRTSDRRSPLVPSAYRFLNRRAYNDLAAVLPVINC